MRLECGSDAVGQARWVPRASRNSMERSAPDLAVHIDDVAGRLEAAFNRRDAAALASLYSETAILMPPNAPTASGRDNIREWFRGALQRVGNVRLELR